MKKESIFPGKRGNEIVDLKSDLVVIGGGMAGTCAAITAARNGIKVILVQDRPVLGGNGSSEVRLWILGATSHMGNNNRWAREGGVIDEILVENLYRNKEGNVVLFDTILLEKVTGEPNITLLLNTVVFDLEKKDTLEYRFSQSFLQSEFHGISVERPFILRRFRRWHCGLSGRSFFSHGRGRQK